MPGDHTTPILYHVERVRDGKKMSRVFLSDGWIILTNQGALLLHSLGKSYCTRTVTAKQRGKNIFVCTASFQVPRPNAPGHQYTMPDVPHHSTLPSQEELIHGLINNPKIPENVTELLKLRLKEVHPSPAPNESLHKLLVGCSDVLSI